MTPGDLLKLNDRLDIFAPTDRGSPIPQAADSLVESGLIPPLPITGGREPVLIWGWSIVRRAVELGVDDLPTRVLNVEPQTALELALQLEARTGHYTWAEQDAVVRYLEELTESAAGNAESGPRAATWGDVSRLTRGDGALVDLVVRFRQLDRVARGLVQDEFLSLKTAERLTSVPSEFLTAQHGRLAGMSFSARRQFLEILAELLAPVTGPDAVAALCGQAALLLDEREPVAAIKRLRYPVLSELEDRFDLIRRSSFSGTGVELTAPPYFEGESFTISFGFRNCSELEERAEAIKRLKGSCEELFGIL